MFRLVFPLNKNTAFKDILETKKGFTSFAMDSNLTYEQLLDIKVKCTVNSLVCVGADDLIACEYCLSALQITAENLPVERKWTSWYLAPTLSFGFLPNLKKLNQTPIDTLGSQETDRLSWSLDGSGAHRVGTSFNGSNTALHIFIKDYSNSQYRSRPPFFISYRKSLFCYISFFSKVLTEFV